MSTQVPPPPIQAPITSASGLVTFPWTQWLTQLYQRIGQGSALSNIELASGNNPAILALNTEVTALQSAVATLNSEVVILSSSSATFTSEIDGLLQGRQA